MKKSYLVILAMLSFSFLNVSGQVLNDTTVTAASTFTRTIPFGFSYEVTIRAFGGGGGGGTTAIATDAAGGGGGGAYAEEEVLNLTAGDYQITVGAGGAPGATGGATIFEESGGSVIVRAAGGEGSSEQSGGLGGSTINSVGTLLRAGGNGGAAGNCSPNLNTGGGGGGGASDGSAGGIGGTGTCSPENGGTGGTGGTRADAVADGGAGGVGGEVSGGNFASVPGGGGGGKGEVASGTVSSANGATGRIEIVINSVLPIELISFEGKALKNTVELNWTTASEVNNDYVAIERSDDAINFMEIGRIPGQGDTEEERSYTYVDKAPLQGINYYRLRQVDFNGDVNRHAIIAVEVELEQVASKMNIYPNPSQGMLQVDWDLPIRRMGTLEVYDIRGKRLKHSTIDPLSASHQLSIQDLPSGLYLLHFSAGDQVEVQRFEKE